MRKCLLISWVATWACLCPQAQAQAQVQIIADTNLSGPTFAFARVPPPASNDAATEASFVVLAGDRDRNAGPLSVLHDGRLPVGEDEPRENFFFRSGSRGGRLQIDLRRVIPVKRIGTYSWHANTRAPQVYTLYVPDTKAKADGFNPSPPWGTDPTSCGWKLLVDVDTRGDDIRAGGQHGVAISGDRDGVLGHMRYLLLDMFPTEHDDPFGNTFYSEIDVEAADGPALQPIVSQSPDPIMVTFHTDDAAYHFALDVTEAPDLHEWAERELIPVVREWYPKLVAMLPSPGFSPNTNVTLRFRRDMGRTPASAGRGRINLNTGWFRRELDREALGSVVHEMVHVVQDYGRARRRNPDATRTPGWLVEGIADYIRWFLYEPESKGAEITARNFADARHDTSYRVTGNFLDWVTRQHEVDIVPKLNAAAREGNYRESLWEDWTGHSLAELGEAWKRGHAMRLGIAMPKANSSK